MQPLTPAPGTQEYNAWYVGNQTAAINQTGWTLDVSARPTVFNRSTCAEIDSVFFWTGTPWDAQARGMVAYATGRNGSDVGNFPTVAASAMEGIGYLSALQTVGEKTGVLTPSAILRGMSDYTVPIPIVRADNGTWLSGAPVEEPPTLPNASSTPGTMYAIKSGNAVILELLKSRGPQEVPGLLWDPVVTPPVVPITSAASSIKVAAASAAAVVAAALM